MKCTICCASAGRRWFVRIPKRRGGDVLAIVHTAPWGYLRLRRPTYDDGDLGRWAQDVAAQGRERAFIFFKHEDDGAGPEMAARFAKIANG